MTIRDTLEYFDELGVSRDDIDKIQSVIDTVAERGAFEEQIDIAGLLETIGVTPSQVVVDALIDVYNHYKYEGL